MSWGFSFQLFPGENIIEDSTNKSHSGVKPAYSVFLTNKRVIFRFDGLGSSLTQSFFYNEVLDVKPVKRVFVNYLHVKTSKKEFFINTSDTDYWSGKILDIKEKIKELPSPEGKTAESSTERGKRELLDMLTILRKNSLLTDNEFDEKVHALDKMDT
ncbi:MAG: hypothetical protein A2X59_11825 [Nitrospirae bacterium GWC2_42_7]|nr:MAG: hypothetical protein A2X59_11825 [Nitrospirae bacterium GWC2_42_7]